MSRITLPADATTLVLNGTVIDNLAEGDFLTLAPVNPLTSHVNSTNGGVNINKRTDGDVHDLTVRVQKFSPSDVFMNSALVAAEPTVFDGSMKSNYTRDGVDFVETYTMETGSITTQPTQTKNNQDGNAMMEYVIRFRSVVRAL